MMPRQEKFDLAETLCVECGNACNSGCSWSATLTPVDGWTAEETTHGYRVIECPLFFNDTDDAHKYERRRNMDNDGMVAMLGEALKVLKKDYIAGYGPVEAGRFRSRAEARAQNRKLIEKEIKRGDFCGLFHIDEPDDLIRHLRRELAKAINEKGAVL